MAAIAAINFRGVGESVKANVVLTCIELTGLLIIIMIGAAVVVFIIARTLGMKRIFA